LDYCDYYTENGYVIFDGLIPHDKIDRVLQALSAFKKARYPYYSQSIHTWLQPEIDSSGFMVESMENFTKLWFNAGLKKSGNDILLGHEICDALKSINPGFANFVQWQNMLFDRSTGTVEHYDSWYLDTYPAGFLTAAWIALEDIDERSGAFRVFPKSHRDFARNQLNDVTHDGFVEACAVYAKEHEFKLALLKKGSVLFWHPSLIHGALNQQQPGFSRKSLTSHYYPLGSAKKGFERIDISNTPRTLLKKMYMACQGPVKKDGNAIYSEATNLNLIRYNMGLLKFAKNKLLNMSRASMDMRRKSY
jgi:phytanoyl-CoA hydroxylase